jgi:hypothetical protein
LILIILFRVIPHVFDIDFKFIKWWQVFKILCKFSFISMLHIWYLFSICHEIFYLFIIWRWFISTNINIIIIFIIQAHLTTISWFTIIILQILCLNTSKSYSLYWQLTLINNFWTTCISYRDRQYTNNTFNVIQDLLIKSWSILIYFTIKVCIDIVIQLQILRHFNWFVYYYTHFYIIYY